MDIIISTEVSGNFICDIKKKILWLNFFLCGYKMLYAWTHFNIEKGLCISIHENNLKMYYPDLVYYFKIEYILSWHSVHLSFVATCSLCFCRKINILYLYMRPEWLTRKGTLVCSSVNLTHVHDTVDKENVIGAQNKIVSL